MRNRCVLVCSLLLVLLAGNFDSDARELERVTLRGGDNSGPGRVFQLAFTSRSYYSNTFTVKHIQFKPVQ